MKTTKSKEKIYVKNISLPNTEVSLKKYKREKRRKEFEYLNKKQFNKYRENIDTDPAFRGYFKVSKFKDKGDKVLLINEDKFDLYKKKPFLSVKKGYAFTGTNTFVILQKSIAWILLLLLFLAILLGASYIMLNKNGTIDNPWKPIIDQNIWQREETTAVSDNASGIQIKGFTSWSIPAGKTEGLNIGLENPVGNPCYFTFEIKLADSGEVLYTSQMVPPGETIKKVNISKPLNAGDYPAIISIQTNELKTGREMNSPAMKITIHVQ